MLILHRKMSDKKESQGSAGAIRDAGGAFAKLEVAHEEEYFYKQVRNAFIECLHRKKNLHSYFVFIITASTAA